MTKILLVYLADVSALVFLMAWGFHHEEWWGGGIVFSSMFALFITTAIAVLRIKKEVEANSRSNARY